MLVFKKTTRIRVINRRLMFVWEKQDKPPLGPGFGKPRLISLRVKRSAEFPPAKAYAPQHQLFLTSDNAI
jgi:hypothetical protein